MAKSEKGASITLRGRFHPGATVELVRVAGAHVLRPSASDEVVDTQKVGKDGSVKFEKGVGEGERYFIRGYHEGFPLTVRVRGRAAGDDSGELDQAPVGYDRVFTRDGREFGERGQRLAHPSGSDEPVR